MSDKLDRALITKVGPRTYDFNNLIIGRAHRLTPDELRRYAEDTVMFEHYRVFPTFENLKNGFVGFGYEGDVDELTSDIMELVVEAREKFTTERRHAYHDRLSKKNGMMAIYKNRPRQYFEFRPEVTISAKLMYSWIMDEPEETIIVDTETTGLNSDVDEIIELAIIDGNGRTILNRRFGAYLERAKGYWPDASKINHIYPTDVHGLPTITELAPDLTKLFQNAKNLIFYNWNFDLPFLRKSGVDIQTENVGDVMLSYAVYNGEWSDYHYDYRWVRLTDASKMCGLSIEHSHGALTDCQNTLGVLKYMVEHPKPKKE